MPLKRLERTRRSLPAGYQFGDAAKQVIAISIKGVWSALADVPEASLLLTPADCRVKASEMADIEGVPV